MREGEDGENLLGAEGEVVQDLQLSPDAVNLCSSRDCELWQLNRPADLSPKSSARGSGRNGHTSAFPLFGSETFVRSSLAVYILN